MEVSKTALIRSIQQTLNEVYANDQVKPVCVPFATLGREIVEKIPSLDGKILVLSDLGLLVTVWWRKRDADITFVAHTDQQAEFARQVGVTKIIEVGYNDPVKELEKQLMGLKFDVIVGNPPYLAGLHITILEQCFKRLSADGYLVFVHPATPFIKQGRGVKDLDPSIVPHIKSLEIKNPALVFGGNAELASPVSITTLTKTINKNITVDIDGRISTHEKLESVSIHSGYPGYDAFKARMLSIDDNLGKHVLWPKDGKYSIDAPFYVELSGLVGDFPRNPKGQQTVKDFFATCFFFAGKTMQVTPRDKLKATGAKYAYAFQSEQEATNCLHYLQTKFARAGLAIFKYNLHIYPAQLSTTPWVDFKQSWTDAQLFKHFGLSEEEKQFVRSMSDIYPNYSEE